MTAESRRETLSARLLVALLYGLGIACAAIAALQIALGLSAIPGAGQSNATVDSEHRFYAVFFLGFGLALIWCARDLARREGPARFLLALFFAGGLARLVSMAQVGSPNVFFMSMTTIELILPALLLMLMTSRRKAK